MAEKTLLTMFHLFCTGGLPLSVGISFTLRGAGQKAKVYIECSLKDELDNQTPPITAHPYQISRDSWVISDTGS